MPLKLSWLNRLCEEIIHPSGKAFFPRSGHRTSSDRNNRGVSANAPLPLAYRCCYLESLVLQLRQVIDSESQEPRPAEPSAPVSTGQDLAGYSIDYFLFQVLNSINERGLEMMSGGVSGNPTTPIPSEMPETAQHEPCVSLHGWDSRGQVWHGPDELAYTLSGSRQILRRLRPLASSWHGRLCAQMRGQLTLSFCVSIHDLGDAGLAIIDLEGSPGGPLEVTLVVPAHRRARVRKDFAFEFAAFLRFLEGPESSGSELAIHDYIHRVLRETGAGTTLVFSIETRFLESEVQILIAEQVERLAMSMIAWMTGKDAVHSARLS